VDSVVVVHYGEIGLKGGNRPPFVRRLADRLRQALASAEVEGTVGVAPGRLWIRPAEPAQGPRALRATIRVPGVANAALARRSAPDLESLKAAALRALSEAPPGTFKVETKRSDKAYPLTSIQVSQALGAHLAATSGRRADIPNPDVTVRVEVGRGEAYVSAGTVDGPGGLPVGSSSRLLAFLSGGLDSPVAAWLMLRRGARVTGVHFHNRSVEGPAVLEKLEDLGRTLAWAAGAFPLVVVPFEGCQRAIVAGVPEGLRMIVYRRAMLRIGAHLARAERALGFVTGDSLGQVASQTTENLRTILAAASLPVYTPLIGSDKREIVAWARRIGTYDVSIRPHADCCSWLIGSRPAVKSSVKQIEALEAQTGLEAVVAEAAEGATKTELRPDPRHLDA
jgi:thiamine biosynthesis protein ThiI